MEHNEELSPPPLLDFNICREEQTLKMAGLSSAVAQHRSRSRSASLPSSRSHTNSLQVEAKIHKLKNWEASSLSTIVPLGAETLQTGLAGLAELYSCIEELIHSPLVQQTLFYNRNGKPVEGVLDMSVGLLDMCGTVRDIFTMIKEHVQELQSALRRKGGDSSTDFSINAYICFRKKTKRDIVVKCLRTLKQMENKIVSSQIEIDAHHYLSVVVRVLSELSTSTISILRFLLLYLSLSAMKTKPSRWSLVSKLMKGGSLASRGGQESINEVTCVDFALFSLGGHSRSSNNTVDLQMTQRKLQTLDIRIQDMEAGLVCLYRRLIQHRVSLLNILTL